LKRSIASATGTSVRSNCSSALMCSRIFCSMRSKSSSETFAPSGKSKS
jgi:hypothetical protein